MWLFFAVILLAPALYLTWNIVRQRPGNQVFLDANRPDDGQPFDIELADIQDQQLRATVTYSGGCGPHTFDLYVEDQQSDVNRLLQLHHQTDDACERRVTEDISFDLTQPIAEHDSPQILFTLQGNGLEPDTILYKKPAVEDEL